MKSNTKPCALIPKRLILFEGPGDGGNLILSMPESMPLSKPTPVSNPDSASRRGGE